MGIVTIIALALEFVKESVMGLLDGSQSRVLLLAGQSGELHPLLLNRGDVDLSQSFQKHSNTLPGPANVRLKGISQPQIARPRKITFGGDDPVEHPDQ